MAPFVDLLVVGDEAGPAGIGWDHRQGAALVQDGAQGVVVEGLVGDQGTEIEPRDQRLDADAAVALTGQEDEAGQVAQRVDQSDDLGGTSAARADDGQLLRPLLAPVPCVWSLEDGLWVIEYSKS